MISNGLNIGYESVMSSKNAFNPEDNPDNDEWSNVGYILFYGISLFSNDTTIFTDNFIFDKSCFQLLKKWLLQKI